MLVYFEFDFCIVITYTTILLFMLCLCAIDTQLTISVIALYKVQSSLLCVFFVYERAISSLEM